MFLLYFYGAGDGIMVPAARSPVLLWHTVVIISTVSFKRALFTSNLSCIFSFEVSCDHSVGRITMGKLYCNELWFQSILLFVHANIFMWCNISLVRYTPASLFGLLFCIHSLFVAYVTICFSMMTSSNGNIFRVTGHLCGEFTGPRWIPHTKASDAELWCLLWSASE